MSELSSPSSSAEDRLYAAIFNPDPMPRWKRGLHHVRWGLRHPYWALCFNIARLSRVRGYVHDSTAPRDLPPMTRRMVLLTSSHDELLDALWDVIPRGEHGFPAISPEFRGRALSLVGDLDSMIFWVREDRRWPGWIFAEEQESGTGAWGTTPEEAVRNYFSGNHDRPHPPQEVAQ